MHKMFGLLRRMPCPLRQMFLPSPPKQLYNHTVVGLLAACCNQVHRKSFENIAGRSWVHRMLPEDN